MKMPEFDLRSLPLPARLLVTWFLLAMAAGFVAAQVNLREAPSKHMQFIDAEIKLVRQPGQRAAPGLPRAA